MMRPAHNLLLFFITALLALLLAGCGTQEVPPVHTEFNSMSRPCAVTFAGPSARQAHHGNALVVNMLDDFAMRFDTNRSTSEINTINRLAHQMELPISIDTYQLLFHARRIYDLTDGLFDVSIGPMLYAWGFNGGLVPSRMTSEVLEAAKFAYGLPKIAIREYSISFPSGLNRLDVEGMLDGFLVDRCIQRLRANQYENLLLRVDRSYRCIGDGPNQKGWRVDIAHPLVHETRLGQVTLISGQAVSVSHAFGEFRKMGNQLLSHIIDPRDGLPVTRMLYTAVLAPIATDSDALATALMVGGSDVAPKLLGRFPGSEALLIPNTRPLEIWITAGMKKALQFEGGLDITLHDLTIEVPPPAPAVESTQLPTEIPPTELIIPPDPNEFAPVDE